MDEGWVAGVGLVGEIALDLAKSPASWRRRNGNFYKAGDGIRTHDVSLGKAAFYH